jgi:hypothetical protein
MHPDPGSLIVADIASYDCQIVLERGRRDDQIGLRERVASLTAFFYEKSPSQHDVFGDFKDAVFEHGTQLVREPVVKLGAPTSITDVFDAESNFGEGDTTDE